MGHHNNGQHPDADNKAVQAPATLLPDVLSRLGLKNGEIPQSTRQDDPVAALSSDDWQTRVAAVHALGKQGVNTPIEPLLAALNDEDASVRAAAIHALATSGQPLPVDRLIATLQDDDWHVRQTAALA